jgi:hypothetical protein
MSKIKSIKYVGKKPVYNLYVEDLHNFLIQGNVISHNCDALRYYAIYWTHGGHVVNNNKRKKWRPDQWEDYKSASKEDRAYLVSLWGEPY